MNAYLLTAIALVVYLALAWFSSVLLGLSGTDAWVLRGGLALIGLVAAGAYLWYRARQQAAESGAEAADAASGDEIDVLFREAETRLAASNLGRGAKIGNLPVVLIAGQSGAAKTANLLNSGLEPELLAGQVYQDTAVAPTRLANLWFAKSAVFVEAGGALLADAGRWAKLVRRLTPGRLGSVVGKSGVAPRAAIICFDCEQFTQPGAADQVTAAARALQARLSEVAQSLGTNLPVYVLFTRADRLPFFLDYVKNLTNEEAAQTVGATLPIQTGDAGVYAEQAAQRLTEAFNGIFQALCDKRPEFLSRETAADKLPGIYEFPREFRKVRSLVVQFLVDVGRPSRLQVAPFIRGFYFSGVRPVVVNEAAPVAPRAPERRSGDAGATQIFTAPRRAEAAPQQMTSRRVPQWVFLTRFFNEVLLADRNAMGASGASVKTNTLRRALLASAAALSLLLALAFTVSFFKNRSLENAVLEAARGISTAEAGGESTPSLDALRRLDNLRGVLEQLSLYAREGAPLGYRWGLYSGDDLYPQARRVYFARFRQLLFGATQDAMIGDLNRLPAAPGPGDAYGPAYNTLKAYLITTSEYKRSTRPFLSPFLFKRWSDGRGADAERLQLAQKQFDFYSDELAVENPYSTANDGGLIKRTRQYLSQFAGSERVYQSMLSEASLKAPSINFNRQFPGSAEVVVNNQDVPGAFTKAGFGFMQDAIKHADRFFAGERWVLGDEGATNIDRAKLETDLRARYTNDLITNWRTFLKNSSVSRYASLPDAAKKLRILSGGQSPLLALFCVVSDNTAVDVPEVKAAFQAPQMVVPPGCQDRYVAPPNQGYMGNLLNLQGSLEMVANSAAGPNDPAAAQTLTAAATALTTARQVAQGFPIDRTANVPATVQKLMEDPITQVERLLRGLGPAELKGKAQGLCSQVRELLAKYPFNGKSTAQATIDDVNRVFRPGDGALHQFYMQNLQPLVQKQGSQYFPNPGGTMKVTPQFLAFFNRAMAFSDAAYAGGAQQPKLNYTLRSNLTASNLSIDLSIDGQSLSNGPGKTAVKQFAWPGTSQGVRMNVRFGNEPVTWPQYQGLWAAFDFFADSEEKAAPAGAVHTLEWTLRTGQSGRAVTTSSGQPASVRFDLEMNPPIFRKGYFSGMACVADVAR